MDGQTSEPECMIVFWLLRSAEEACLVKQHVVLNQTLGHGWKNADMQTASFSNSTHLDSNT